MLRTHVVPSLLILCALALTACGSSSGGTTSTVANVAVLESEPNDSSMTATPLTQGQFGQGNVDIMGDVDYWAFDATAGQLISIELFAIRFDQATWATNNTIATLVLFDTDGVTRLLTHEYSANFSNGWTDGYDEEHDFGIPCFEVPATGTYYVCVTQDDQLANGGAYAVHVKPHDGPAITYREMEPVMVSGSNDTFGTAEAITPGRIKGFRVDDEMDYYSFTITEPTTVRFTLTAHRNGVWRSDDEYYDPALSMYDTDGTTLLFSNDDAYFYDSSIATRLAVAGTYYVAVEECCGAGDAIYFLDFEVLPGDEVAEVEPNDTFMQAQSIPYDTTIVASKEAANLDWYAIDGVAGDAIWIWHFAANLLTAGQPTVIAPDGTTLMPQDYGTPLGVVRVLFQETGTHYIRINQSQDFDYALRVERPFQSAFESESNDTIATADSLDGAKRASGRIDTMGDLDLYSFDAQGGTGVVVSVLCSKGGGFGQLDDFGSNADVTVTIRDAMGNAVATSGTDNPSGAAPDAFGIVDGLPSVMVAFVPPATGTYYVEIAEEDGNSGVEYLYLVSVR